jgi:hypothetical protein
MMDDASSEGCQKWEWGENRLILEFLGCTYGCGLGFRSWFGILAGLKFWVA